MKANTEEQILDVAQDLVRCRGYNAFSYADISAQVGIRKASIHYYFPTKDDLGRELVRRYREAFQQACDRIVQANPSPKAQLLQFAQLYQDGLEHDQLCLCGMLAADFRSLSEAVQKEVQAFFAENVTWLNTVLARGCELGAWQHSIPLETEAQRILATLQGAQLLCRTMPDSTAQFAVMIHPLIAHLRDPG